jgi:hypothetical protein
MSADGRGKKAAIRPRRANGTLAPDDASPEELAAPDDRPWQFKKGVSGNPGGKPKLPKILRDLIGELTNSGADLVTWMNNVRTGVEDGMKDDARVRLAAGEWMCDHFFGKAKHTVALTDGVPVEPSPPVPLDALLQVLDDKDRSDLERILVNFEMAKRDGRLALPEPAPDVEDAEVQ